MKLFEIIIFFLIFSFKAHSFPENVRHGYFSCTTCHVSPSGGDVLTPYGRSLSSELMSTWGSSKMAGFLFSDLEDETKNPTWFRAQIYLKGVQTRRNSSTIEKAEFIPMQSDLELGYDGEKFAIIAAAGYRANDSTKQLKEFYSRRHYALFRPNENWALRGGKFMFAFGLNGPDHVTATRRGLNWDQGTESYNLEASYNGEMSSTILTLVNDSPEEKSFNKDKGFAVTQAFFIGGKSKVGISAFKGNQAAYDRIVAGPFWIWSITKDLYLDSEFFNQNKILITSAIRQNGYVTFHRLGYEVAKGLTVFGQFDRSYLNVSDENSQFDSYGPGIQWLPYPHVELKSYLGKEKSFGQAATDFWWLMLNIYL